MEAFRGNLDNARRLFREGKTRCRPSSRYLREWGAFEKRAGSLDVSPDDSLITLLGDLMPTQRCASVSLALSGLNSTDIAVPGQPVARVMQHDATEHARFSLAQGQSQERTFSAGVALPCQGGPDMNRDPDACAHLQEAAALYKRAAEMNPNDERTWLQYGLLERRRGQLPSARVCFTKGIQAAPHNPYMYQV